MAPFAGVLGLLPVMAFMMFWGIALLWRRQMKPLGGTPEGPLGPSFLVAACAWGVCVVALTEGLSAFEGLSRSALAISWLLVVTAGAGALVGLWRQQRQGGMPVAVRSASVASEAAERRDRVAWAILVGVTALILGVSAFVAFVIPPNNWDAMTYHLARVMHWIQNGSVGFYPTNDTRQLFDPPWAEYALLQFQLLTGGDHLANFVQWFSGAGVCVGAKLIAERLGANRTGQGLAMVIAASTPMAILQSSSPQNDLVTSFWVVTLIYFALVFTRRPTVGSACLLGAALGLAMLTKGTAYVFAAPALFALGGWWLAQLWRRRNRRAQRAGDTADVTATGDANVSWSGTSVSAPWLRSLGLLCLVGVFALALNAPQWTRNEAMFHSPLGPDGSAYANQVFTVQAATCNAARDLSLETSASTNSVNTWILDEVSGVCRAAGFDVSDTRISWAGQGGLPYRVNGFTTYEGTAGNPLQTVLIVMSLLSVLVASRLRRGRAVALYAVLLVAGLALFIAYVRWQPWGNRLLLPWYMAAAPLVGVVIGRLPLRWVSVPMVVTVTTVAALPFLFLNQNASLVAPSTALTTPRLSQYYVSALGFEKPERDAATFINQRQCLDVGLHRNIEGWEYPYWLLIGSHSYEARIEHVLVTNPSGRLASGAHYQTFHPCAIIDEFAPTDMARPVGVEVNGQAYHLAWSEDMVAVYLPGVR